MNFLPAELVPMAGVVGVGTQVLINIIKKHSRLDGQQTLIAVFLLCVLMTLGLQLYAGADPKLLTSWGSIILISVGAFVVAVSSTEIHKSARAGKLREMQQERKG